MIVILGLCFLLTDWLSFTEGGGGGGRLKLDVQGLLGGLVYNFLGHHMCIISFFVTPGYLIGGGDAYRSSDFFSSSSTPKLVKTAHHLYLLFSGSYHEPHSLFFLPGFF